MGEIMFEPQDKKQAVLINMRGNLNEVLRRLNEMGVPDTTIVNSREDEKHYNGYIDCSLNREEILRVVSWEEVILIWPCTRFGRCPT